MLDAHGNLKGLSQDMSVLYKHIEEHSKGGSDKNGFFKSIFGTSGMNGAMILAKNAEEVGSLTEQAKKYGKTGAYVAKLADKNMRTAQGSANSARQAMNAFKMTLGNAVLPAINEASNSLAKFLLSKDGEKFQKNVGKVVGDFANGLVSLIRFATQHETMMKFVGGGFLAGYATVKVAKAVSFVGGLYEQYKKLAEISPKVASLGKTAGQLTNFKTSFRNMTKGAKLAVGVSAVFSAAQIGNDFYQAATAKSTQDRIADVGAGAGNLIGTGIGAALGGKTGAAIGSQLGQAMGPAAAKSFNKAFNPNTRFNLKNPKPIAHGKKHIVQYTENGYYYTIGKGKQKYFKDQRNYSEKELNTGHRLDATQFLQAKNPVDFVTGALSGGYQFISHLTDLDYLKRSIKFANASSQKGWFNDFFFKPMGKPKFKDHGDIGKGFRTAIGNWFRSKPNAGRAYQSTPGEKWIASLFSGNKVQAAELTKAQRKALRDGKSIGISVKKGAQKGMQGFPAWAQKLGKKSNDWFKGKWSGMEKWSGAVNKNVQSGWHGFTSWSGNLSHRSSKFFKSKWSGMQSWAGGINKDVQSGWKGIKTWFGNLGKNAVDLFKKPFEGLSKWVSDHTPKPVKAALGAVGKGVNWVKGKLTGKAHANGGLMHTSHGALVGEAGPELAYKPYANNVRLLGANGPQFTKVHAGEHILNARDTAKVLNGGLGNGLTLKGYASGTDKLGKTSKKVTNDYKQIADKSSKSLNSLSKKSSSTWNKITRQTGKDSSKTRKRAISDYSDMHKGIVKQMDKTHDGVISLSESTAKGFGKALDKTKGYARDAMSDSIGEINKGITGIDKVLGQFGGNTSVIKPVKFATGTDANGRLTENTLAMVNDAQTGPRQEALVSDKNELFLPRGNNVTMMLPKGWGVLNGTQTQQVAKSVGVKHFAKGSGLSHSALRKLAEKAGANPAQSFKEMFLDKLKPSGSNLKRGSIGLAQNSSQHFGNPWSNAMWTVINNAIGGGDGKGGTREAFLKYAERTFSGVPYQMGAASKKLSDCSGMVSQALEHFGINIGRTTVAMQSSSGVQYLGKSLSKTIPGDLVIFGHGTGAAGHVGIIKNPHTGTMFNETPPHARVTSIADDKGMGYGYYRVRGLHNASQSKKQAVADKRLISLAKQELGHHAISWIKKNLSDDLGSLGSFSIGGDLAQRAKALAAGLRKLDPNATKNGIAAILGNWNFESGGLNPGAVNPGGGASGLGQWLGGRKANLIAYARRHGTSWKNAGTQLSFAVKGEGSDSAILRSILEGSGSVASLANKFSAEWERGGYNAQHVRGAMEIRKALGYAKGGRPKAHTPFIAGERGPELITADGPVKVDSHEQTKRKVADLAQMFKFPKINRPTRSNGSAPVININFNGPIYGTKEEAKRIAELVRREINKVLVNIGDEFGTDPSLY